MSPIPLNAHLFLITPATVHVFECVFLYIVIYIYAWSRKLVLLLFLLQSSGSSPLFTFLQNRGLIRRVVLSMRQVEVLLISLHLRLPMLFGQHPVALDARDVCFRQLDLRLIEMMDGHSGRARYRYHGAEDSYRRLDGFKFIVDLRGSGPPCTARPRPRVGCRGERPPQHASLPCWRAWMCLCVKTLARTLVRTTKIETQTGQTSRRKWITMPRAVCGRVHRKSLPTPITKPSQNAFYKPPYLEGKAGLLSTSWLPPLSQRSKSCSRGSLWWSWLMVAASSKASSSACCCVCGREGE